MFTLLSGVPCLMIPRHEQEKGGCILKIPVVLSGTGLWAENHLKAYACCPDLEVVAIVGHSNAERLSQLAKDYQIPSTFMDLDEALAKTRPAMLDVSGNPHYRLAAVQSAVGTSVRHVNLEKPMALTPSEADAIEALCKQHGLTLTVNHQKKYNAPWAKARDIIEQGTLGKLRFFRATCKGNLLEQGTHLVDMLLFFQGYQPIDWVMGCVDDLDGLDKPKASAPDSAIAQIGFSNGVRAHLALGLTGWDLPETDNKWFHMGIEAYGDHGHLCIELNRALTVITYGSGNVHEEASLWDDTFLQGLATHLDKAARYGMELETDHLSSLEKSMMSFKTIMGIYKSACGGGRVRFPAELDDSILERLKTLRQ